jgi:hypothetical protein
MKTTILRPDGTKIEIDGTAEEAARVVDALQPKNQFVYWPSTVGNWVSCGSCGSQYLSGHAHLCAWKF